MSPSSSSGSSLHPETLILLVKRRPELRVVTGNEQRVRRLSPVLRDLSERAPVEVSVAHEQRVDIAAKFALGIRGVADDHDFPAATAQDDRLVTRGVAGGGDESDRTVAEDIDRAGEAGERLDGVGLVVDRPPIECVVELALVITLTKAALGGGRPLPP